VTVIFFRKFHSVELLINEKYNYAGITVRNPDLSISSLTTIPVTLGASVNSYIYDVSQKRIRSEFYILLTVHLDVILVNDQLDALFLNVFISSLYMFRAASARHQEVQIVLIHHLV
jgi:hypothetical protein